MRKLLALTGLLAFGSISPSAFSLGLFLIQSATVTQIDADSYRLRVDVYWTGETIPPPGNDPTYLGPGTPYFTTFALTGAVLPYNLYSIQNGEEVYDPAGDPFWTAPLSGPHTPGSLGGTFGYDFDYSGALANMPLTYMAGLDWYAPRLIDAGGGYTYIGAEQLGSEVYYGRVNIAHTPEPGTLVLLAAGLAGVIAGSKLRRRQP